MKKLLFSFVLILFISCTERPSSPPANTGRFVIIYQQDCFSGGTQILLDTITGEKYLFHKCGYSGGLTHL